MIFEENKALSKDQLKAVVMAIGYRENFPRFSYDEIIALNLAPDTEVQSPLLAQTFLSLSFYRILNSLHFYCSHVHLSQGGFHIQAGVMRYYSIFFSLTGLIELNLKGILTLKYPYEGSLRRYVYISDLEELKFKVKKDNTRNNHQFVGARALELINQRKDFKYYSTLMLFKDDPGSFSDFRNWENYSTQLMLEDLAWTEPQQDCITDLTFDNIFSGRIGSFEEDCYPEDCWTYAFLKTLADEHTTLLSETKVPKHFVMMIERMKRFYKDSKNKDTVYGFLEELVP